MRERQRVELLRDLLAGRRFLSIADLLATIVVDPQTRAMEAA
jgi:hypothetical protein